MVTLPLYNGAHVTVTAPPRSFPLYGYLLPVSTPIFTYFIARSKIFYFD